MANVKTLPNLQALSRSPSPAQTLPSEAVLDGLKMLLIGASLNEVLTVSPVGCGLGSESCAITEIGSY